MKRVVYGEDTDMVNPNPHGSADEPTGSVHSRRVLSSGERLAAAMAGGLVALPWLFDAAFATAWIGMSLLIAVSRNQPAFLAFRIWIVAGIVAMGTAFHWLPEVASRQLQVSWFSGLMVALFSIVWDAFRFGVFGWLVARFKTDTAIRFAIWPVVWVALEWIWPHVFPWRIGQTQIGWLSLCQIAEVTGVYGVSFLVVGGSALVAETVLARQSPAGARRMLIPLLVGIVTISLIVGWGTFRIRGIERTVAARERLRVAVIQPGSRDHLLDKLRSSTRAMQEDVDLFLWGESSIDQFSLSLKSFASADEVRSHHRLGEADRAPCPGLRTPLLCGGGSFAAANVVDGPFRNTAYLVGADGTILSRYHKRVLMPWGEYAVGQQWLPGLREVLRFFVF